MALFDHLRDLEERLFRPDIRRSPDETGALLADDFFEFGQSGMVWTRRQTIDDLAVEPRMVRFMSGDFSVRLLCDDVAMLTYRSVSRDPSNGTEQHALRCSIWKRTDGRWQMAFHQGTPTRPHP
jgi:hypothetical protein